MHNPRVYGQPMCVCVHLDSDLSAGFLTLPEALLLRMLGQWILPRFHDFRMRKYFEDFGFGSGQDYRKCIIQKSTGSLCGCLHLYSDMYAAFLSFPKAIF